MSSLIFPPSQILRTQAAACVFFDTNEWWWLFMFLLKADEVSVEIKGHALFESAYLEIGEGNRIALIGNNGVGKTTFIKSLVGNIPISKGRVSLKLKKDEIGWMDQESLGVVGETTREWIEMENAHLYALKRKINDAERKNDFSNEYMKAIQQYMDGSGYEWEADIERQLSIVGLPEHLWSQPINNLSGGQKTRAKLAKVMIKQPKLLILDEPTNHLDTESIDWLVEWISQYRGAVLFTSHEREFIDRVANTTYELTIKGTRKYDGGYSFYFEQKQLERKTLEAQYKKQESEKRKLVEAINQYRQWFNQAHAAASERDPFAKKKANKNMTRLKAKEKALERLESSGIEKPANSQKINYQIESEDFSSRMMITISNVQFSYGDRPILFDQLSLMIKRGDRVAVVGRNGTGKTTLLKLMTGNLHPTSGKIIRNPQVKIGYFMQELEGLNENETILQQILSLPNMTQTEARTILACFLFRREDVLKKVKDLSMGEKCRVAFVKLYFSHANLLVFDEPTNYLDIETRERMEEALSMYPGAVIMVSHDPYLLKKVANRVIELNDGEVFDYPGTYNEWLEAERISNNIQSIKNKKSLLELQLTNLIAEDIPEEEYEKGAYYRRLKQIKEEIYKLENDFNQ
ncbi:ribosomal protection-like ABC-F family protein [Heyndrickxia sporothermodurans]